MKTIKQWLETIEDKEIRKKALSNMNESVENQQQDNLWAAIGAAFYWNDSPEGHDFWSDYVNSL